MQLAGAAPSSALPGTRPRERGPPALSHRAAGAPRRPVAPRQSCTTNVYSPSCSCLSGASG